MPDAVTISAIEYCLPRRVLTNDELQAANPEWDMQWVAERTGVRSRHIAGSDELASDLGYHAVEKLLAATRIERETIDALIVCTVTPDYPTPPNSALLHARLGLGPHTATFDFNHVCSGYVYGVAMAKAWIESLGFRRVVLVSGDTFSRLCHPRDKSTYTLCGDGVAATLFERSGSGGGIRDISLGTDGRGATRIFVPAGGMREPRSEATGVVRTDAFGSQRTREHYHMNGAAALAFARKRIPPAVREIVSRNRLALSDVGMFFFHQASEVILDAVRDELGLGPERVFSNLAGMGNTTSASLPILLKDADSKGLLRRGDWILLVSFGAGFSWGCCLMEW